MSYLRRILNYLNPIAHLGDNRYSFFFPFLLTLIIYSFSEIYAYRIASNPLIVGSYIIYTSIILVIYFAFRSGIRGGFITTVITVFYYFYIIYTRNYTGEQLRGAVDFTILLGISFAAIGLIIGWLKQAIDKLIEEEANEKRRLQVIIHQLPVGIIIANHRGVVTHVNKKISTILGIKIPVGAIVGKDTFVSYEKDGKFVNPTQTPLYQVIHTGKPIIDKDYVIERPDGNRRTIQVNASGIRNRSGKMVAAASIVNDITSQKEIEDRKDEFVNMASHELKTPLTSLKLYIDALAINLKQSEDKRLQKTIQGIKQQSDRLLDLVNSLLDVSRLQTGKLNFVMKEFRIDTLVKESVDELSGIVYDGKKIQYHVRLAIKVVGDEFRIHQVITNLITNAIKYSPANEVIHVSVKKDSEKAIVSVEDKGIGIAKEQQRKIFDRLYQVSDPNIKTFPGLGMGLYISREIIKKHKGRIWVESEGSNGDIPDKKKGSTFYFTLPLAK